MTLWDFLSWIKEYWLLILWGAGAVVAYIYGGRNLALVVLTLGIGSFAYSSGRKSAREEHDKRAAKIKEKRENEYEKIDNRGTNRDDVIERLRKHDY